MEKEGEVVVCIYIYTIDLLIGECQEIDFGWEREGEINRKREKERDKKKERDND